MAIIIGFDLGDGDTLASKLNANQKAIEMVMPGGRAPGHPVSSFYARANNGTVTIGNNALFQSNAKELMINFKKRPSKLAQEEREKMQQDVVTFMDAIFLDNNFMRDIGVEDSTTDNEIIINIGYPTKWNREDAGYYLEMLQSCRFLQKYKEHQKTVHIDLKKESRAAILNLRYDDKDGQNEGQDILTKVPSGQFIVVFDFGSSTTDVTVVSKTEKYSVQSADYGDSNLGARLIDRGIYQEILSRLPENEKLTLEAADPKEKNQAIGICREAKEKYFRDPEIEDWYSIVSSTRFFPLNKYFSSEIMQKALAYRWPELNNRSYQEACKALFEEVAQKLQEQGLQPALIILTGGASRMPFVKEYCEQAFSTQFNCPQVSLDSNPSSSIAKGLAYTVLADENAKAFQEEIDKLCEKIPQMIEVEIPKLSREMAQSLMSPILEVTQQEIILWRTGEYATIADLEEALPDKIELKLQEKDHSGKLSQSIHKWLSTSIGIPLDSELAAISNKFKITYDEPHLMENTFLHMDSSAALTDNISPQMKALQRQIAATIQDCRQKMLGVMVMITSVLVGFISQTIIGTILANALTWILIYLDPWITGGLGALLAYAISRIVQGLFGRPSEEKIAEMRTKNVPLARRNHLTDQQIRDILQSKKATMEQDIRKALDENDEFKAEFSENVTETCVLLTNALSTQISLDLS